MSERTLSSVASRIRRQQSRHAYSPGFWMLSEAAAVEGQKTRGTRRVAWRGGRQDKTSDLVDSFAP